MLEERLQPIKGYIETSIGKIQYMYYGDKKSPVTICCNGFLMSIDSWAKVLPSLQTRTDVLVWDYLVEGTFDTPEFLSSTPEESSNFIKKIIYKLELQNLPIYLLGISTGGFVALEFARLFPELTTKVILSGTMLKVTYTYRYMLEAQMELLKQNHLATFLKIFYSVSYSSNFLESIYARFDELKERFIKKVSHINMPAYTLGHNFLNYAINLDAKEYKKITAPIIYIYGEDDFFNTPDIRNERNAILPQAKFISIPGSCHYPIVEKQKDFFAIIDKFL